MIHIGTIEQSLAFPDIHREKHTSSFEPCERPKGFKKSSTGMEGAYVNQYLPCHYFGKFLSNKKESTLNLTVDLMVGTSTGGYVYCSHRIEID